MTDIPKTADLDQLKEIVSAIPHCRELGLEIMSLEPGKASSRLEYQGRLVANPQTGVVHGGVISTLLDTVSGLGAMWAVRGTKPGATLDLRIEYLKTDRPGDEDIGE